ncbi:HSP20-like chaperone [Piromyces finnis]|uniref:HSP20-like chaperone n=1 Tax=Piromyces finnis TaxID=1754191 RepID=A0A1Y1V583_9FUNG|nr:HSP20-like chaperone [Piromyces finnis]|eukprot:ORX46246.1 HSP20-like chaperone [Piromyces finnis]
MLNINNYPFYDIDRSIQNNSALEDNNNYEEDLNNLYNHPFFYPNTHSRYNNKKYNKKNRNNINNGQASNDKDVYKLVDFSPNVNLGEDTNNYYIEFDLPGMTKNQINIELDDNEKAIIISGVRPKMNTNGMKITTMDCQYGRFSRTFSLPEIADFNKIEAKMENGVLQIVIPKNETLRSQSRTIEIQ